VEINQEAWDRHQVDPVTKEWYKLWRERMAKYEKQIPLLLSTGTEESIAQARIASGAYRELEDWMNTRYEHMKEGE